MTTYQHVSRWPWNDGQEQWDTGTFRADAEAAADARWRISLAIKFCLYDIYLLHSLEPTLCRVMYWTLAVRTGYLLPAQCVPRSKSFPKEAIWRIFLHLFSPVQEFIEKWMIANRVQDFFYLRKLQRRLEVSPARLAPRFGNPGSPSNQFSIPNMCQMLHTRKWFTKMIWTRIMPSSHLYWSKPGFPLTSV